MARIGTPAEHWTHAVFAAIIGTCNPSEAKLSTELVGRLQPGMLSLTDRDFTDSTYVSRPDRPVLTVVGE